MLKTEFELATPPKWDQAEYQNKVNNNQEEDDIDYEHINPPDSSKAEPDYASAEAKKNVRINPKNKILYAPPYIPTPSPYQPVNKVLVEDLDPRKNEKTFPSVNDEIVVSDTQKYQLPFQNQVPTKNTPPSSGANVQKTQNLTNDYKNLPKEIVINSEADTKVIPSIDAAYGILPGERVSKPQYSYLTPEDNEKFKFKVEQEEGVNQHPQPQIQPQTYHYIPLQSNYPNQVTQITQIPQNNSPSPTAQQQPLKKSGVLPEATQKTLAKSHTPIYLPGNLPGKFNIISNDILPGKNEPGFSVVNDEELERISTVPYIVKTQVYNVKPKPEFVDTESKGYINPSNDDKVFTVNARPSEIPPTERGFSVNAREPEQSGFTVNARENYHAFPMGPQSYVPPSNIFTVNAQPNSVGSSVPVLGNNYKPSNFVNIDRPSYIPPQSSYPPQNQTSLQPFPSLSPPVSPPVSQPLQRPYSISPNYQSPPTSNMNNNFLPLDRPSAVVLLPSASVVPSEQQVIPQIGDVDDKESRFTTEVPYPSKQGEIVYEMPYSSKQAEQTYEMPYSSKQAEPLEQNVGVGQERREGNYDVPKLLVELNKLNKATDDPNFDPDGWKRYYSPNDKFFNYEYGDTKQNQVLIKNPNDITHCEIYEGETNQYGQKHGYGILTTARSIKRGDFRNDEFCGWGREARKNRVVTEAKFVNGLANGKGMYRNAKGNIYTGDFLDGKRHGYGELDTNKFHYEGQFNNDYLDGKGKIQFLNTGHQYQGDFKENEMDGYGVFKWKNGYVYEGFMKNGKMNGKGRYKYNNGQVYEGGYRDGLKNGMGRLTYPNGKVFEGRFVNGIPDGEATLLKNGRISKIEYDKGRVSSVKNNNNY